MKLKIFLQAVLCIFLISATAFASPTLQKNSSGDDVLILQKKLYLAGYTITEFDGIFGDETERAVSAFQRDKNITVTGKVTNVTWRALKNTKTVEGRTLENLETKNAKFKNIFKPKSEKISPRSGKTFLTCEDGQDILQIGKQYLGVPYVFGGITPDGFDCSGFVQYVFNEFGYKIPRLADEQYSLGYSAKISQLDVGDLVFFETYTEGISHIGIYAGNRQFLHVSSSKGVRIDSLDNEYWSPRFVGAKKITD